MKTKMTWWDKIRFWGFIDKCGKDDCWEWLGGKLRDGYGEFRLNGKTERAHRLAYLLKYKKIPRGLCVCHHCDNAVCVNPDHLFLGTNRDNTQDAVKKGRMARGEDVGSSKLIEEDVKAIRQLYKEGIYSQRDLAGKFGVTHPMIGFIVRRERWAHVD